MSEFSVHGKRFYPEPMVSFPRLEKFQNPVHFSLPGLTTSLMPQSPPTPPPVGSLSSPPSLSTSPVNGCNVPLPGVPHLANYMLNNRVSLEEISGSLASDISLSQCRSSKDLIEVAKQFSDDLSVDQISRICDLRDKVFHHGGAHVFTPEQFVQFYGFYNMFLTEERSWEPRLSEKFYNSSRTRLRCSCRWTPRLNKRARTTEDSRTKHKCSAVYDMSYWPMHKLVIWECVEAPNHPMNVNASILNCQYMENLVHRMKMFSPSDIEIIIKAQLAPLTSRLFLENLDCDRVRTLLRSKEDPSKTRGPELAVDIQMAEKYSNQVSYQGILSRTIKITEDNQALIMLHKDLFRSMLYSDSVSIKTTYRVSLHSDSVSAISLSGSDGRRGVTIFMPMDETDAQFENAIKECLCQIEHIGYELFSSYTTGFVGLANIRKVNLSLASQRKIDHLSGQLNIVEEKWTRALKTLCFQIADISRFDREVSDPEITAMLKNAYSCPTVRQGEDILLDAIRICESRNNVVLESYLRTQFQYYHKWGSHKTHWTVEVTGEGAVEGSLEPQFGSKHSITAIAIQFGAWLSRCSQFRPKPVIRSRIALSSVLCSPPASEDS